MLQAASTERLAAPGVNWNPQEGSETSNWPPLTNTVPAGFVTFAPGFAEQGFANEVNRIRLLSREKQSGRRLLEPSWSQSDIQVPGGGWSFRSILHFFNNLTGKTRFNFNSQLKFSAHFQHLPSAFPDLARTFPM